MAFRSLLCGLFRPRKAKAQDHITEYTGKEVVASANGVVEVTPRGPSEPPMLTEKNAPPQDLVDLQEISKIRELCPRFRVLIIGRANSGKTTILKKVCDTDEEPVVHDENGKEVEPSELKGPDAKRGIHDIRLEITFKSNPQFVFHDSMGFEAGSANELEIVREFIKEMLAKSELRHRLHAIWYCVPTDADRVAFESELSFFQQNTGDFPVVLVFTKWDGQIKKAFNTLRQKDRLDIPQARDEAPRRAKKVLVNEFLPIFQSTPFPPRSYSILGDMHKPETKCSELSEKTEAALDNLVLKKLFVRVQTHNLGLCVKGAIAETISRDIFSQLPDPKHRTVLATVISWFPHLFVILLRLSLDWDRARDYSAFQYESLFLTMDDENRLAGVIEKSGIFRMFQPMIDDSIGSFLSYYIQLFDVAVASSIISTHSFSIEQKPQTAEEILQPSIDEYLASKERLAVQDAIGETFRKHEETFANEMPEETRKSISEELLKICMAHLLAIW